MRFCLVWSGKELLLEPGQYFVGSNPAADVVIDDPLVSRRHARLLANDTTVLLEDLRSENGVYVNQTRVRRSVRLEDGDRIVIGRQELAFRVLPPVSADVVSGQRVRISGSSYAAAASSYRPLSPESGSYSAPPPGRSLTPGVGTPAAVTIPPRKTTLPAMVAASAPAPASSTLEPDAFESVGVLADNMLALGRAKTAERLLHSHLNDVLAAARRGESVERGIIDFAAIYAMRLAASLHDPAWVHYVIELHVIFALPVCATAGENLRQLVPLIPGVNRALFAGYQRALLASLDRLSVEDIALAHAILQIVV